MPKIADPDGIVDQPFTDYTDEQLQELLQNEQTTFQDKILARDELNRRYPTQRPESSNYQCEGCGS